MRMVMNSKLVRALSSVGGRPLYKTAEVLAASIAGLNAGRMQSDGSKIKVWMGKDQAIVEVDAKAPVIQSDYYAFQDGTVAFSGTAKALERVKATLLELVPRRKEYLQGKDLSRYKIDDAFVSALAEKVSALEAK